MQLWKHPNGVWYVLHGERLRNRVSTRTKDRPAADVFLTQFSAAMSTAAPGNPTVGWILRGYEHDALNGVGRRPVVAQTSLKSCAKALLRFFEDYLPEHLTPNIVQKYTVERGHAVSDGSTLRDLGVLRAALAWAVDNKHIRAAPHIPNIVETPQPRERWLTRDEARVLIAACVEPHVKTFIYMALGTTKRSGAILSRRWTDIDWSRRVIAFGRGTGNKRRGDVPMNDELFKHLEAVKQIAVSKWVIEWRGERIRSVKNGFASACERAKLTDVTPHILRHTGATWMAMDGVPLQQIADFLGDTLETTQRVYKKYTPEYLRGAASALQLGQIAA